MEFCSLTVSFFQHFYLVCMDTGMNHSSPPAPLTLAVVGFLCPLWDTVERTLNGPSTGICAVTSKMGSVCNH